MSRCLEIEMEIDASIEAVWKALTEARELVRWFPLEAGENDDGTLWMSWGDGNKLSGSVAESDPPRRIRFVYRQPPPGADPSTVKPEHWAEIATEYRLSSRGGTTVLRLVHSGFGDGDEWDDLYDATRLGWAFELRGLKHYLENHPGRERLVAWAKASYAGAREDAWKRLMSPEGLGELGALTEGVRYRTRVATGDELSGVVRLLESPTSFVATVDDWNDAFLRVKLEDLYGLKEAHVWLSAYDVPKDRVEGFQERMQAHLERVFTA